MPTLRRREEMAGEILMCALAEYEWKLYLKAKEERENLYLIFSILTILFVALIVALIVNI